MRAKKKKNRSTNRNDKMRTENVKKRKKSVQENEATLWKKFHV